LAEQKPNIPAGASRFVPPVGMLVGLIAMVSAWYFIPGSQLFEAPYSHGGWGLFVAALGLSMYAKCQFVHVGTGVRPFTKTPDLVMSGPFKFSRNPMYLAMVIELISVGVILGKIAPFIVVPLFIIWIRKRFIDHEEQLMETHFGDAYRVYKSCVRRWF
jgi:protein-S-isoprenylcysteine O-methyltransferase Ste14